MINPWDSQKVSHRLYRFLYNSVRRMPWANKLFHSITQSQWVVKFLPYRWIYRQIINYCAERYRRIPPHLEINITNACNAHCIMCPPVIHMGKDFIEQKLYEKIITEASEMGIRKLTLAGGEPLLDKRIFDKIRLAKAKNFRFVHMFTNGAALNETNGIKLIESELDSLTISIDSPLKEEYEKIRIGLKFDKVYGNIRQFWQIKQDMGHKNPIIRINMVEMSINQKSKDILIRKFSPYADIVEVIPAHNFGGNDNLSDRDFTPDYLKKRRNYRFPCNLLFSKIVIDAKGLVKKCSIDYADHAIYGDTRKDTLCTIWNNALFVNLRIRMLRGQFDEPGCKNCNHIQSWWIDAYSEVE